MSVLYQSNEKSAKELFYKLARFYFEVRVVPDLGYLHSLLCQPMLQEDYEYSSTLLCFFVCSH